MRQREFGCHGGTGRGGETGSSLEFATVASNPDCANRHLAHGRGADVSPAPRHAQPARHPQRTASLPASSVPACPSMRT
ncbi:hypothetical protein C7S13_1814 [Burkholderia cepacia]|nr:hypothetical protein [Burkholderia cepacia]